MSLENKVCQNCKSEFHIEMEDVLFYEKMKVPEPTWCADCRMQRRLLWRNLRSLYKRDCGLCGKSIVTMYHPDDPAPVYCNPCWLSDKWDPYTYGMQYDSSRPFFVQWNELLQKVPRYALYQTNCVGSEYTNYSVNNKNCYLSYSMTDCEDIRYCENLDKSRQSFDSLSVKELEHSSENIDCQKNFNVHYALATRDSLDSRFVFDCANCSNCFMSSNLRNRSYVFRNRQYTQEEYESLIQKINFDSYITHTALVAEWDEMMKGSIHRYANIIQSQDATGNFIAQSRFISNSFTVHNAENIKNGSRVFYSKDGHDMYGFAQGELVYDIVACSFGVYRVAFSSLCEGSKETQYSLLCKNVSDIFGSISIKDGSYVILNTRYTKDEYEALRSQILNDMASYPYIDRKGRIYTYGEFFPTDFAPFGYNETLAFDLYHKTKEELLQADFPIHVRSKRAFGNALATDAVLDRSLEADNTLAEKVITCAHVGDCDHQCTEVYRITSEDLSFYQQHLLPLPHMCPNCRHYERLSRKLPNKLWSRSCMCEEQQHDHDGLCLNEFQTSYSPDRLEKVYCESCYQKSVL